MKDFSEKLKIYKEYLRLKDIPPDFDFTDDNYTEDDIKELLATAHIDAGKVESEEKLDLVSGILEQVSDKELVKIVLWTELPQRGSLADVHQIFSVIEAILPEGTALDYSLAEEKHAENKFSVKYVMWLQN